MANGLEAELNDLCPELLHLTEQRDSTARLLEDLTRRFTPRDVEQGGPTQRAWELVALLHRSSGRPNEALQISNHR